jgi:hypothetical protein
MVAAHTDAPYDLDQVLNSNRYRVVGEAFVRDQLCVLIEHSSGRDRIWLATDKGYVVVQREWRWEEGAPLKRRIHNRDFRHLGGGVWLPFASSMEVFGSPASRPNQRVGLLTAVVADASLDFPDADFRPSFPKGTVVDEYGTGRQSVIGYTSEELAARNAKSILQNLKRKAGAPGLEHHSSPWWVVHQWALFLAAGAILAVILAIRIRRSL